MTELQKFTLDIDCLIYDLKKIKDLLSPNDKVDLENSILKIKQELKSLSSPTLRPLAESIWTSVHTRLINQEVIAWANHLSNLHMTRRQAVQSLNRTLLHWELSARRVVPTRSRRKL